IAEEVKYLDVRMDKLNYDIRMMAMMATRTKEDAEQLAGILQVAEAAESISNAAGYIVDLLFRERTGPILPKILKKAEEHIYRIKISKESKACNQRIGDLRVETETGMRIIAIRRGEYWIYNPDADTILKADDWLIVRGTREGYEELKKFLHGELEVLD
ncbi:MAG TPA: potassium transporter TrkA, partial [Thermoplasmatales archaeon]|nr:potassium transporter TrkA [Thermoplasmatales archaeon]